MSKVKYLEVLLQEADYLTKDEITQLIYELSEGGK